MKNLIIVSLLILASACGVRKEQNKSIEKIVLKKYQPLDKFNNDTLLFVQQSILDRKQYYIGKELSILLKDLNIPIVLYSFYPAPTNIFKVYDTYLQIRDYGSTQKKLEKNEDPVALIIRWNPPLNANALDSLPKGKYTGEWTPGVQKYLSKQIVGDIVKTDFKLKK